MSEALVKMMNLMRTPVRSNLNLIRTLVTQKHDNVAIVSTNIGDVAGKIQTSNITNQQFLAFKGIPYAEPPKGDLRFAPAVPKEKWNGVRECFDDGPISPQPFIKVKSGDDCLYLNVYTPKDVVTGKLPVMVWFHGGAYIFGSGRQDLYGPDHLLNENVVIVTLNFRLGAQGYLTTEDDVIPCNNATTDQILAMKWVKENIDKFGGDPDNITLFGQSTGATHITQHLINPHTAGLYKRAICQSGGILNRWAVNYDRGSSRRRAFKVGKLLGCDTNDSRELLKHLRKQHPMAVLDAQFKCLNKDDVKKGILFAFHICPEPDELTPREKYESGLINNVPVLMGSNSHEGFLFLRGFHTRRSVADTLASHNKDPVDFLRPILPIETYSNGVAEEAAKWIMNYYFGQQECNMSTVQNWIAAMNDVAYIHGKVSTSKYLARAGNPVYLFQFTHDTELGSFRRSSSKTIPGVAHSDDLCHLFNTNFPNPEPVLPADDGAYLTRRRFVKLWTNFAKFGHPTPKEHPSDILPVHWEQFTENNRVHFELGAEPVMKRNVFDERIKFWDELFAVAEARPTADLRDVNQVSIGSDDDEEEAIAIAQ